MNEQRLSIRPFSLFIAVAAALCAAYLGYMLFRYVGVEGYLDHTGPNTALNTWRLLAGYPLYYDPDAWPIFGGYPPLVYLIHSIVFKVVGASISTSKLAGALASAGSVAIFFFYAKNRFGILKACVGVLLFISFILLFSPFSMWSRPDPFIVFFVTVAVAASNLPTKRWGEWTPHVIVGICIGLAVNLKIHSFIYFIPVAVDLCGWKGIRRMIVIGLVSIAVFLIPFAHPQISITKYLGTLFGFVSERQSFDKGMFIHALRYSLFFFSPGLLLGGLLLRGKRHVNGKDAIYFAALTASIALALYPSSSAGMGTYHMLPLLVVSVDAMLRLLGGFDDAPRIQKVAMVLLPVIFLTISVPVQRRLMRNLARLERENAAAEVHDIASRLKDETVQMGYGETFENYRFTFLRPILVFAGQPDTIDVQFLMESGYAGVNLSKKLVADISACKTHNWLIPKGEKPFAMRSYYRGDDLFGQVSKAFQERYEKTESLQYYDIWSCRD